MANQQAIVNRDRGLSHHVHRDTIPTGTIGAAFILSIIMGLFVVSGVLLKPYEAKKVFESWQERIMLAKEYRELSRISYTD